MSVPQRTAIVMSRLPRLIDPRCPWLRGLRAALRRIRDQGETLVVVDSTAGFEFVRRGAERLAIPIEVVAVGTEPLGKVNSQSETPIPLRDRTLVEAAQTVMVLGVRTNGFVHRALVQRLQCGVRVEIVEIDELQTRAVRDDLIKRGATSWSPDQDDQSPLIEPAISEHLRSDFVVEIAPFPSPDEWIFLSHTTRAYAGPWPDQTQIEYIDSLLDDAPDADHSARAALERILTHRRLRASGRTNRGGNPVVCFTEVPLSHLPNLRQFRPHRMRWDFEPYGLCIHRDWLQKCGARRVLYGDESTWNGLPESDRPFFQLNPPSSSTDDHAAIDWSIEQEWRHAGDVDLRNLPSNQGLVFVPGFDAAMRLAAVSPWPITLWPDPAIDPSRR